MFVLPAYLCTSVEVLLPVWQCPPRDCWCLECCHHFPEPVDSEYSSTHRWSSSYVYLAFVVEGQAISNRHFKMEIKSKWVSVTLYCMCITQYRDLARGLLIVNQQVSFDCSCCQKWACLWPQDEGHLISFETKNGKKQTQIMWSY